MIKKTITKEIELKIPFVESCKMYETKAKMFIIFRKAPDSPLLIETLNNIKIQFKPKKKISAISKFKKHFPFVRAGGRFVKNPAFWGRK